MKKDKKKVEEKSAAREEGQKNDAEGKGPDYFRAVIAFIETELAENSLDAINRQLMLVLSRQLGSDVAAVYITDQNDRKFRLNGSLGRDREDFPRTLDFDSAFVRWIRKERGPLFIDRFFAGAGELAAAEMDFLAGIDQNGLSYACAIGDRSALVGVLFFAAGSSGKGLSAREAEFVEMLSRSAAVKMRELAMIDEAARLREKNDQFSLLRKEVTERNREGLKTQLSVLKSTLYSLESDDISSGILIDMARSAVMKMESRMEQFLSLCDIGVDGADLDIRKTEISSLIEEIMKEYIPELESKNITVRFDDRIPLREVYVDPVNLGIAVRNIVDNAIFHIDRGGVIEIGLHSSESGPGDDDGVELGAGGAASTLRGDKLAGILQSTDHSLERISREISLEADRYENFVVIRVRDDGPGIAAGRVSTLSTITGEGNPDPDRSSPGRPTGLAIARMIAESHGGKLFCRSSIGSGSEFSLWVPDTN
ncbi:MAG: HAMP domain-containing histidine kinase [Candidatus Krumholzibacteriota bacterium]|nr:HAMP domain-containing histidine kinase [Candidatus Krumholzibacteriota bacterium]